MQIAALFLSSAVAALVTAVLLSPPLSRIVSFVLALIRKQHWGTGSGGSEVPDLPLDIVIDILSRLPVKTLMRFKCVSKNWNQIISNSPYLVSLHLIRSQQAPNCLAYSRNPPAATVLVSSPDEPRHYGICSSGDLGLFLVGYRRPPSAQSCGYALWNPATRKMKHLPEPPCEHPARDPLNHLRKLWFYDTYGVGLDSVANAVKVVVIRKYAYVDHDNVSQLTSSAVYEYTLNDGDDGGGGWRKIAGDYPYINAEAEAAGASTFNNSTHFKGSIYWLCWEGHILSYMVTFDLGTRVFRKVKCPFAPPLGKADFALSRLHIYRDSIAAFVTTSRDCLSVDVWTLTTQEEELCWIKDSSSSIIGPFPRALHVGGCCNDNLILAVPVKEDQHNVLVRDDNLVVYDTVTQNIILNVPNVVVCSLFPYKPTLVNLPNSISDHTVVVMQR